MTAAVLFDLGNTLASYYRSDEFQPILAQAVDNVLRELRSRALATVTYESALESAVVENREADDFRVLPMAKRLERIFKLSTENGSSLASLLCERFLSPIFAIGRIYDDAVPVLTELRFAGYRTAIVSNAPWGSPPALWRQELRRLRLDSLVDSVVFCGDVGWRKPAPQIFRHAAAQLGVPCDQCLFVGDDPCWDIQGSAAVGMLPVLLDRGDDHPEHDGNRARDLYDVLTCCDQRNAEDGCLRRQER
jgi:putative hydrolase of the HAD superfamily